MSTLNIPGFYYDPATNNYYKIAPSHETHILNETKVSHLKQIQNWDEYVKNKKKVSFTGTVLNREIENRGLTTIPALKECCFREAVLDHRKPIVNNQETYKGKKSYLSKITGTSFILSGWEHTHTHISQLKVNRDSAGSKYYLDHLCTLIKKNYHYTVQVAKFFGCYYSCIFINYKNNFVYKLVNFETDPSHDMLSRYLKKYSQVIWDVGINQEKALFAFGSKNQILINFPAEDRDETIRTAGDDNFAVKVNPDGNLVYTGTHSGYVRIYDRRTDKVVSSIFANSGVKGLTLLDGGQKVIASAYDNFLSQFDLRINHRVLDYAHHVNVSNACPIVIEDDLLCCAGSDHIARIWSLSSGNLLTYLPVASSQPSVALLYSDESRHYVALSLSDTEKCMYEIC